MNVSLKLVRDYAAVAAIHDALYSWNLTKTGETRGNYHAKHFPEQFALVAVDEAGVSHGGIACHWENAPRHVFGAYIMNILYPYKQSKKYQFLLMVQ